MEKNYSFDYRCNLIGFEEKQIESKYREENRAADIRLAFDHKVEDDRKTGVGSFKMKVFLLHGKGDKLGQDYELNVGFLVNFEYKEEIPETSDGNFWFPLVSDLYIIAQDKLKGLASSQGIARVRFDVPLPSVGFEVLRKQFLEKGD